MAAPMASAPSSKLMQTVDGTGTFKSHELEQFVKEHKVAELRQNYQIVAIMGPQSSGKSTLLNHLFGTTFVMMDAMSGRSQTTKGIWLARSPKISEPVTLVMDLEGSDGRERGEDDTNFERQSALFALAVADVLMVNIWCHDIGREHGSGKPLLKTIFQVNLKLFAPDPDRKRTVLLFVLRDKTKTPMPRLVETLQADLNKMWESIRKPAQYKDSSLTDFFEVQYAGLSHYEEKYEDFLADTVVLRRRFTPDADDSLVRTDDKLPGDSLALSMGSIWEVIRSQKDLNLPAHKVMVANIRCAEIAEDQMRSMLADQAWQAVAQQAGSGEVAPGFGSTVSALVDSCIKGYEAEAMYFDPKVRDDKQQELQAKLVTLLQPLVAKQVAALRQEKLKVLQQEVQQGLKHGVEPFADLAARVKADALDAFQKSYQQNIRVQDMPWDGQEELADFSAAADEQVSKARSDAIASTQSKIERQLASQVSGPVHSLLDACPTGLWPKLHALCHDAASSSERTLFQLLQGFKLDDREREELSMKVEASAVSRMEGHVREAALTRMSRMKDKFNEVFTLDKNKTPRHWTAREDIPALAQAARLAAAAVLAQLAVLRRPQGTAGDSSSNGVGAGGVGGGGGGGAAAQRRAELPYGVVEDAIMQLARNDLQHQQQQEQGASGNFTERGPVDESSFVDVMSAASWPGVDEELVLVTPQEVRTSWREFMSASNVAVQQAMATQQANKLAGARSTPLWALLAIAFLGWNELMAVVWNPLYLIFGLVLFLFGRTLYYELDVDSELQKGSLPAAISLGHKFVPATKAVLAKSVHSLQAFAADLPQHAQRAQHYLAQDLPEQIHKKVEDVQVQMSHLGEGAATAGSSTTTGGGLKQRRPGGANSTADSQE